MGFDVKNTTKMSLLDVLLPYFCRGCGKIGEPLCSCCKKYIMGRGFTINDEFPVYVSGKREGVLKKLVVEYKFKSRRGLSRTLAEIIASNLPEDLPKETAIVPLPTISRHIRERGFDHTLKLGKELSKITGFSCIPMLKRVNKTVQVGADEATRAEQAANAYEFDKRFSASRPVLLLDDVYTTGASMRSAAAKIREAGGSQIFGTVVVSGLKDTEETKKTSEEVL